MSGEPADVRLLRAVADSLMMLPYSTWSFGDSVAFEGMVAASRALGDDRWLSFARGMVRGWASRPHAHRRLDCTAPGLAMVQIYQFTDDTLVLDAAHSLAQYLVGRPRIGDVFATWEESPLQRPYGGAELGPEEESLLAVPPAGVFVDCLHFDPPFFAALGQALGKDEWTDEAVRQTLGYIRMLQTPQGLFDHFVLAGSSRRYGPGWGRGQGWALLGLLDVLDLLPSADPRRLPLAESATRLITAMLALQRDDGHWYAVVDSPESGLETSTAAFMACGLMRAVRLGLCGVAAGDAAQHALAAAISEVDAHGHLLGVSAAVNACTHAAHYVHVPRGFVVPWGQGPLALALAANLGQERSQNAA